MWRPREMLFSRRSVLRILAASCPAVYAQAPQGMASRGVKPAPRAKFSGLPFHAKLTDVARQAGLSEVVVSGHPDRSDYITEAMGCGAAFFDYDNDGWLDIFISDRIALRRPPCRRVKPSLQEQP